MTIYFSNFSNVDLKHQPQELSTLSGFDQPVIEPSFDFANDPIKPSKNEPKSFLK